MRFVVTFDEGISEVRAFRDGEGKSFFQKVGGFLGHAVIVTRNMRNMVMKARPAGGPTRIIGAGGVGLGRGGDVSFGVTA